MEKLHLRRNFDPVAHDLDANFRLTKHSDLKGCGCKVPHAVLDRLLGDIFTAPVNEDEQNFNNMMFMEQPHEPKVQRLGTAGVNDCSIISLKIADLCMLQSSDYLYPLVDDPYMMGIIVCGCVLSDLYATGVTTCDSIQMLLGLSSRITAKERDVIAPLIIRGFKDAAETAGCAVRGGSTVVTPWMLLGGTATTVVPKSMIIMPHNAMVNDVLVLTKPLGTHIACTARQWMNDDREKWSRIKVVLGPEEAEKAFQRAMASMARLNKSAADVMRQYNAHGSTHVSGYGLLGAAQSLVKSQTNEVDFVIHNLPVIAKMNSVNKVVGNLFNLNQGLSPETSGGLLIVFPREDGASFAKKMEQVDGLQSWIVGVVQKGSRTARVIDKPRVIEVPMKDKPGEVW